MYLNGVNIKKHKNLIWSLLNRHAEPNLSELIRHMAGGASREERSAIEAEIHRLSESCSRKLDFRPFFANACEAFYYQAITHYLDPASKEIFDNLLEQTNTVYNIAIYEDLTNLAKARYIEIQKEREQLVSIIPAKELSLDRTILAKKGQEGKFEVSAGVFTFNPKFYSDVGLRNLSINVDIISLESERIVFRTNNKELVMCDNPYIYLHDYDSSTGIAKTITLKCIHKDALILPDDTVDITVSIAQDADEKSIKDLIVLIGMRDNPTALSSISPQSVYRSIEQRIHEHYLLNNTECIPMVLTSTESGILPRVAYITEANNMLWQNFKSSKEDHLFSRIIGTQRFQRAIAENEKTTLYFFSAPVLVDGNKEILAFELEELVSKIDVCSLFKDYYQTSRMKLLRFEIGHTNIKNYKYSPSSLQNMLGGNLAMINAKPTETVSEILDKCSIVCTVYDESFLLVDLGIDSIFKDAKSLPYGKKPIINRNILPHPSHSPNVIEAIEDVRNVRTEDRFSFATKISLAFGDTVIIGKTVNISSRGLCIEVEEPSCLSLHQEVKITFDSLNKKIFTDPIVDQSYRVVNIFNKVVNLVAIGSIKESTARRSLTRLIYANLNKLKATGIKESVYGLSRSMRSIHVQNNMSIPFFVSTEKRHNFIETIIVNKFTEISNLNKDENKDLLGFVSSPSFSTYVSKLHAELSEENPCQEGYLILLPRIKTKSGNEKPYWISDLKEVLENENGINLVKKLISSFNLSVLKIKLSMPCKLNDRYFGDEMRYLKRTNPSLVQPLEAYTTGLIAIGEIFEVTDVVVSWTNSLGKKDSNNSKTNAA